MFLVSATLSLSVSAGPKLFDGTDTQDYPWTAWIERNGSYVCGASILSNKWVLTSGDCVFDFVNNNEPGSFRVYVGEYDRSGASTFYKACNVLYNKNYESSTNANNMGMLELETPLSSSATASPVPAYAGSKIDVDILKASTCVITGFGEDENGVLNDIRQVVSIRVRSPDRCAGLPRFESAHHVCYSTDVGGPCKFDTGSPIVCNITGVMTQIAAQLDETCTTSFHYGEYTYKDRRFIREALENPTNQVCPEDSLPNSPTSSGCGPAGKSFMVAFPSPDPSYSRPTVYITCETDTPVVLQTGADIRVYVMRTSFFCTASNGLVIPLPVELASRRTGVSSYSIRIVADQDIFVMAGYELDAIGTTQLFPEDCLKNFTYTYTAISYSAGFNNYNEVIVVAIQDSTTVRMSAPINADVTLNAFDVYKGAVDATGATITASGPLAVFTGIECGNIDSSLTYCDTMFEQMPPTSTLQKIYIVPTNLPRYDMILRIVPINTSTTVNIRNILNTGQTLSFSTAGSVNDVPFSNLTYVESSNPIILGAFSYGGEKDLLKIGDPSMLIVPAIEEYTTYYKVYAPPTTGYNYVTLIISTLDDSTGLRINGAALPGSSTTQNIEVPLYGLFDVITVLLDYGVSTIEHTDPQIKFGVIQYNLQFYRETASAPRALTDIIA